MAGFLDEPGLRRFKTKLMEAVAKIYLGKTEKAASAKTADTATSASSVPWTGVSGKPNLVQSVNGVAPDGAGNVIVQAGVKLKRW